MTMDKAAILIVDDEKPTRDVLARALSRSYDCTTAPDAETALAILRERPETALLLTDYKMPGMNGRELVKAARLVSPSIACILVTAFGEIELAVEAMKDGADDFVTKPVTDLDELELRIGKAIAKHAPAFSAPEPEAGPDASKPLDGFTGESPAMMKVYALVRKAARSNANVLVEGPSGTGKELVARALHDLSARAKGPFVAVECAALSPTLLESELFGHEKGAFTDAYRQKIGRFEAADGGTIFLDEITEIDLSTQVKLLRVLETKTFQRVGGTEDIKSDFRLVAATNRDIAGFVKEGKFREDLYYRLDVIDIRLPPLSERPGDIRLLAERFVKEFAAANSSPVKGISPEAMAALERREWAGNVRQLRNAIEKMVVLASGDTLGVEDLPPGAEAPAACERAAAPQDAADGVHDGGATLAATEKETILATLDRCGGNKTAAAKELGISRRTLHRKLNAWKAGE